MELQSGDYEKAKYMEPGSGIRQVALFAAAIAAIMAISFAALHRKEEHKLSIAPTVAPLPQAVSQTAVGRTNVPSVGQNTPQPSLPPPETSAHALDDPTAFTSLAESEVSRLKAGITLADWRLARGGENWESAKPEILVDGPGPECLSLRKTDTLPSGAKVVRVLYFYPQRVPSPIVFPSVNASAPFDSCMLAILRLEAEAGFSETGRGHAMAQAIAQRFTQIYGISTDPEEVRRRGIKFWGEDGGHWVANIDIISGYDTKPGLNPDAPGQLIQGPVVSVFAHLLVHNENEVPSSMAVDRPLTASVSRKAVDRVLFERIQNLDELVAATCDEANWKRFPKIVQEGEALLTKNIDGPTTARIHFMVGDAYSDMVAIAGGKSGANGEYDPSEFASESEADRAKALEHYKAGLAIDNTSSGAKKAWSQAWHLATGLVPEESYVCVGD